MPTITVVNRAGAESQVPVATGQSLMENLRAAGYDEIMALCGGCCSCATCHVIIDEDSFGQVGAPGEEEDELLDSLDNRAGTSRLSCQVPVTDALEGLRLTIAVED